MSPYRSLSPADCPLLADDPAGGDLVDLANGVARQLNDLAAGDLRSVLDRDDGRRLTVRFERAREHLARTHYRVGFLGTSSAGKSTIFNLVLKEKVAESGAGDATTSLPSRLRRRDGDRQCLLFYLTEAQYRDRLKKLCVEVGLGSPPDSEDELLALLAQLKPTPGGAEEPGKRAVRADDLRYLKAFVASYKAYRSRVSAGPPTPVPVPFDDRSAYINHSDARRPDDPADGLLLAEAHLFIPNPHLPDRLELVDLPGLNAKRSVDGIITGDFLDELDGALVFVNVAENLSNAVVKNVLDRLAYRYGDELTGRAWVVFNKCDTLTESHYFPDPGRRSVFDNIRELLREAKVPVSQVVFTSRRLIEDPAPGAKLLGLPADQPVPATCPDELRPVWDELLRDGGVGRLRHLILNEIARSVAAQIRSAARAELTRLRDDVTFLAEAERRRRTGGPALRQKAVTCRNAVLWLRQGLAGRAGEFPVLAELRDHLRGTLARLLCPDDRHAETLKGMPPAKLEQQFHIDARNLDETLDHLLLNEVIDKVYQKLGEHLDPLPPVPVGKHGGVSEAWQEFRRADRADPGWQAAFPEFASDEVLAGLGGRGYQHFDGETYLDLMGEKVRVAVGQVVHGLRTRLRHRLGELEAELDCLLAEDGQRPNGHKEAQRDTKS
jgi:hypothetical protein